MTSSLQLQLDGTTLDPSVARRAVMRLIGDESSAEFVRDAVLLTSELVTNAVVHVGGAALLHAELLDDTLRVELTDASDVLPKLVDVQSMKVGGRGLHLVNDRASRWGVTPRSRGKTMWFELDR